MLIHHIKRAPITAQPDANEGQQNQHFEASIEAPAEKIKILVLEPDHIYRDTLCRFARRRGALAIGCGTFQQLKNSWIETQPDIVIISFIVDEKTKAPEIIRLLGNIPVLITRHPKTDMQLNFTWPIHLKKIIDRTEGASAIIADALSFATEFRAEKLTLVQMKTKTA